MTDHPALTTTREGDVLVVTIDDGKANALSPDLVAALRATVETASSDARALVLAGRPGKFSAGFDLQVMTSSLEGMRGLVTAGAELLLDIFTAPIPVVAACTGHALAAGGLLLLVSDYRIGADVEAKIGLNEVAIGLTLPIFGVEFARYRCPPTHFDATAVHATIYDPAGAVGAGFLDRVVAVESVVAEAIAKATELGSLRAGAFRGTKAHAHRAAAAFIRETLADDMASLTPPAG